MAYGGDDQCVRDPAATSSQSVLASRSATVLLRIPVSSDSHCKGLTKVGFGEGAGTGAAGRRPRSRSRWSRRRAASPLAVGDDDASVAGARRLDVRRCSATRRHRRPRAGARPAGILPVLGRGSAPATVGCCFCSGRWTCTDRERPARGGASRRAPGGRFRINRRRWPVRDCLQSAASAASRLVARWLGLTSTAGRTKRGAPRSPVGTSRHQRRGSKPTSTGRARRCAVRMSPSRGADAIAGRCRRSRPGPACDALRPRGGAFRRLSPAAPRERGRFAVSDVCTGHSRGHVVGMIGGGRAPRERRHVDPRWGERSSGAPAGPGRAASSATASPMRGGARTEQPHPRSAMAGPAAVDTPDEFVDACPEAVKPSLVVSRAARSSTRCGSAIRSARSPERRSVVAAASHADNSISLNNARAEADFDALALPLNDEPLRSRRVVEGLLPARQVDLAEAEARIEDETEFRAGTDGLAARSAR